MCDERGPRTLVLLVVLPLVLGGCGGDTQVPQAVVSPPPAPAVTQPSPPGTTTSWSPASPRAASPASATPAGWGPPFRVTAGQARGVATVIAFLQAYNAGQRDAALALLTDDVVGSDCDYWEGRVILFEGKERATTWLRERIAEHDQLLLGAIENAHVDQREGGSGAHVVAVTYARRSSDSLRARGFPDGITPDVGTKVVFTRADDRIGAFANGPGGGPAELCQPVPGAPGAGQRQTPAR